MNKSWQEKLTLAKAAGVFLAARVPAIRAVVLTGSVAYGDVKEEDDLDFLIIVQAGHVWRVRAATYFWAWFLGKKRRVNDECDKWCLNMFLDEEHLVIPKEKRTEFARLQLRRARIIVDRDGVWERMKRENAFWTGENFEKDSALLQQTHIGKRRLNALDTWLEWWAWRIQYAYMWRKMTREYVSRYQIFFHPLARE